MQLLIIYGAEATGKLTIAKEVAKRTGFRLFHNHLSADLAGSLFDYGTSEFSTLVWDARLLVFDAAARADLSGLIFTWAYSHPDFLPYLERIKATVAPYQTEIVYAFVTCSDAERERRVTQDDRGKFGKLTTIDGLHAQRARKNYQVIPDTNSLMIDNTEMTAQAVAAQIVDHFKLPSLEITRNSASSSR